MIIEREPTPEEIAENLKELEKQGLIYFDEDGEVCHNFLVPPAKELDEE